jgi:tRNA threonylcarbamoyladenosine biosynthesis protein TsaB
MNILAFDTCLGACSAAVGLDVGGPAQRIIARCERRDTGHAEALLPMVRDVMAAAALDFEAIDRVAVTTGPGTFTGTRIGISAALGFSLVRRVSVVGASSLALMASQAAELLPRWPAAADLAVAVDVRRDQVYIQLFGAGGRVALGPPLLLDVADAARLGGDRPIVLVGSGSEAVAAAARREEREAAAELPDLQPDARHLVHMAYTLPPATKPLRPLYLRAPDAKPNLREGLRRP